MTGEKEFDGRSESGRGAALQFSVSKATLQQFTEEDSSSDNCSVYNSLFDFVLPVPKSSF
ncbi:hypothetical protein OUZ56_003039 [Daphnia magna]|uniref:Uncharacterized protein n=1 Tax=Daphnia magna TaxID=35525 RepID=A0ABR0A7I8_9CRUS|nr:hypothetical protein OUZ56_003039 [Daphnia magna]